VKQIIPGKASRRKTFLAKTGKSLFETGGRDNLPRGEGPLQNYPWERCLARKGMSRGGGLKFKNVFLSKRSEGGGAAKGMNPTGIAWGGTEKLGGFEKAATA